MTSRPALAATLLTAVAIVLATSRAADTPSRPKVLGIAYVKFLVTDLNKAKAFYGNELELPSVTPSNGNLVQASFAVSPTQRVDLVNAAPGTNGSDLVEIGLATDDLNKMRAYLTTKGVGGADEIQMWPDQTKYFMVPDPEGHQIVFVEPPRNPSGPSGGLSHKLIHAGFVVKNADVENRFYENVLGFHVYWHGGMTEGETNWMAMQVPDGTDWIEYMLRIPADADKQTLGVMNHISLGVPSVKSVASELAAKGVKVSEEPKIGRDGKWQLNLYDPDDTRVEFMDFSPSQKPCCADFTGPHPKP
jgi:catechol 2,3-dioxygenase-like lactoylglutathione lyase family enzyme